MIGLKELIKEYELYNLTDMNLLEAKAKGFDLLVNLFGIETNSNSNHYYINTSGIMAKEVQKDTQNFIEKLLLFNEATQSWVNEEEEYIGIFNHCQCPTQTQYYVLDSDEWLPTNNACWSANRIRSIKEVLR